MKELQNNKADSEIVSQVQQEQRTQVKFFGSKILQSGHKVWELDLLTGIIWEAEYTEEAVDFKDAAKGMISTHKNIVMKKDCYYCSALNLKNAQKKFIKAVNERHGRKQN